jgi:hypothetical protein
MAGCRRRCQSNGCPRRAVASSISRVTPTAVRPGRRITARASACQRSGALGREVYLAEPAGQEVQQRREEQQARPPGAAAGEQPGDVPPAAVADGVVQQGADRPAGCLDACTAVDESFGVVAACRPVRRCRRGPAFGPRIRVGAGGDEQRDRTSPHRDTTTPQCSHVSRHSLKGLTLPCWPPRDMEAVRCRESHLSMLAPSG